MSERSASARTMIVPGIQRIGKVIYWHDEVSSTNDLVKELALQGAGEGIAIAAGTQTKGRGQQGRPWISNPGLGVYCSCLLRPPWTTEQNDLLAMLGAVAAREALAHFKIPALRIKWPNDVLAGGRKICGVLAEPRLQGTAIEFAVLGIGINVRHQPADWPPELAMYATSCLREGIDLPVTTVLQALVKELDQVYDAALRGPAEEIRARFTQAGGVPPESKPHP